MSSRGRFIVFFTKRSETTVPKNAHLKHNKINIKTNGCNNCQLVEDQPIVRRHNLWISRSADNSREERGLMCTWQLKIDALKDDNIWMEVLVSAFRTNQWLWGLTKNCQLCSRLTLANWLILLTNSALYSSQSLSNLSTSGKESSLQLVIRFVSSNESLMDLTMEFDNSRASLISFFTKRILAFHPLKIIDFHISSILGKLDFFPSTLFFHFSSSLRYHLVSS